MLTVRTRSGRVKDPGNLENGKLAASEATNSDAASMKSTSDSGLDLCLDEETTSASARRHSLKRKQQSQPQDSVETVSKKSRTNRRSSAQHSSVSECPNKVQPKSSRRSRKTSAVKPADVKTRVSSETDTVGTASTEAAAVKSNRGGEMSSRSNATKNAPPLVGASGSSGNPKQNTSTRPRKKTPTSQVSSEEETKRDEAITEKPSPVPSGRPKRAARAPKVSTIVNPKIPKADSDEESYVESETDFSDNDDEDFVPPETNRSDDDFAGEASDDGMFPEEIPKRGAGHRPDRKSLTAAGRDDKLRDFLNGIGRPCSTKVRVDIRVGGQTKPKAPGGKTERISKAKPKSVRHKDDEGIAGQATSTTKVKKPTKKKRAEWSSDESDVAPEKTSPTKKVKTGRGASGKKTFMKPRRAPKPKTRAEKSSIGSSRLEMTLLKLAKQMDDSDESDDGTQDSSQAPTEVKTEQDPVSSQKQAPEKEADKRLLIMSMLKEHEDVDEMSDDDSDEDGSTRKAEPGKIKSEVSTADTVPSASMKTGDDDDKIVTGGGAPVKKEKISEGSGSDRKQTKSSRKKAEKKKGSNKKGAAMSADADGESSGSDEDNWEVVEDRDPNYQRPENVTVVLKNEDFLPETKRLSMEQRMVRLINRKRRTSFLLCHRVHLMALVGHHRFLNSVVDDENVKAYALSRLPPSIAVPRRRQKDSQIIKDILFFYNSAFELKASDEVFEPKRLKANLIKLLIKRVASCNIVHLFGLLVLLRASGIRTRLCLSYHLLPIKAPLLRMKDGEIIELGSKTKAAEIEYGVADFFIEVYLADKKRWRPVDTDEFVVMEDPHELTPHLEQPVACLIGIDEKGCMVDLSPKYNADWLDKMKHLRSDAKFFDQVLARYAPAESEQAEEQLDVEELHEQQGIPKIISQFKNHPKYALTRHLLKFEAFYPREPPVLGYVRKEPVYPRECVHTLRSKDTWHRQARQVKEGELPYSVVKARPKWNKQTDSFMKDLPLEVYGEWQTEPYEPPVAENGVVPRNKFGNVELFHPDMLPIGTVHLKLPGLQRIAAELEVDCVPAVIGFDGVGRGCHPVLEGFVVCIENQELLEEAWNERQREDRHKRRERIQKRALKNWRKLIKKVIMDLRIKKKYKTKFEQD